MLERHCMAQVNTVHQMACFKEPDPTTRHPSWNCAANVFFTAVKGWSLPYML